MKQYYAVNSQHNMPMNGNISFHYLWTLRH